MADVKSPQSFRPVTLGDLARERRLLWCFCRGCTYEREVAPRSLGLSDNQAVPTAGQRLKYSRCGSKDIETLPQLHPEPLEVIRGRYRGASGR
jgi:hypothetical protein